MARDIYVKPGPLDDIFKEYKGVYRGAPSNLEAILGAAQAVPMGLDAGKKARETRGLGVEAEKAKIDLMRAQAGLANRGTERETPDQKLQRMKDFAEFSAGLKKPKPPTGYKYNAEGTALIETPGGPAEQKTKLIEEKKQRNLDYVNNKARNMNSAIDDAEKIIGASTTGIPGRLTGLVGYPKKVALDGYLNTIKSNLGFDELNKMRQSSPTGGALGNVSDRELALLTATIASLDPAQGEEVLRGNLNKVKAFLALLKEQAAGVKEPTPNAPTAKTSKPPASKAQSAVPSREELRRYLQKRGK